MLIDKFGRVHDYLRISLTERCNMRCTYCMPAEGVQLTGNSKLMTNEEVTGIAEKFVNLGVKKIRLTGGEPLLRKGFDEIIEKLGRFPVELTLTSNGILVDKYIEALKKAGIKSVNISLDSLNRERLKIITRSDFFEKIVQNIDLLLLKNFHVKVNVVLMKGVNDNELIDFIKWTEFKYVHVRFIEFMPFDGNNWDWSKGVSYKEIMDRISSAFGKSVMKLQDKKNDTSKNYRIENFAGTFAIISSVTNPFCDSCNRIRLTADGKIKNCLFSNSETDLLTPYRRGEDITDLISENILSKKAVRAGMETFSDFSDTEKNQVNRSMILIGG